MDSKRLRILMVEDSKHDHQLARRTLERSDVNPELEWVQRGEDALVLLGQRAFDVLVLDFQLPGISGMQTFEELVSRTLDVPTVFLTGAGNEQLAVQALKKGARDYLVKDAAGHYLDLLPVVIKRAHSQSENERARRRAEAELAKNAADLAARNAELDAFAHTVAHEIKGPLMNIIGYARLIENNATGLNADQKKLLQQIPQSAYKLEKIVNELLLLSNVRASEANLAPLDMAMIVSEARKRLHLQIGGSAAELVLPASWPVALGYGPWIEEVWVNYIANGLRYGGRPPRLELRGFPQDGGMIRFEIKDNGSGISPTDQARLFVPFTQLHKVLGQGHGLGLSIVRRIVEKCGGQVGVDSKLGSGSAFWFTLPVAQGPART